jgi:hypothetical protein
MLRLDVFCRMSAQILILRHLEYTSVDQWCPFPGTNLMILLHNLNISLEVNEEFKFAGFERLSVGFLQNVFEMLTKPGDIVLDWAVGGGASFTAGKYSNRFVIRAAGRSRFIDIAKKSLKRLLQKKPSSAITAAKKPDGHATLCSNEEDGTDLREDIATRACRKLKARETSDSIPEDNSEE